LITHPEKSNLNYRKYYLVRFDTEIVLCLGDQQLTSLITEKEKKDGEESGKMVSLLLQGDLIKLKQILKEGRSVNTKNLEGQSFLHIAAICHLKVIFKLSFSFIQIIRGVLFIHNILY
jgi:hypothetical protein